MYSWLIVKRKGCIKDVSFLDTTLSIEFPFIWIMCGRMGFDNQLYFG